MSRVARSYVDALGTERAAAPETVARFEALLAEGPRGFAPATIVLREHEAPHVDVTLPAIGWTENAQWEIVREDGGSAAGVTALRDAPVVHVEHREAATYDTRRIALGDPLPAGAHRVSLAVHGYGTAVVHLLIVPAQGALPHGRTWGIALQLYTLRSHRNLGIGDFADLRTFCELAGARGASYVGINPLHAAFRSDPEAASPYAAASRLWLNWLAIAVDELPEARDRDVRALLASPAFAERAAAARATPLVDYGAVAALKDDALRACFAALAKHPQRETAFEAWRTERGEALQRFAVWEVLVSRYGRALRDWPASFRAPASPDVALFAAAEDDEIRYAAYLQWCAAEQLAAVAEAAARRGLRLYRDLAVGVDANAADVWADAGAYVQDVSVGAPPDALNTIGQDWGLPPLDPNVLAHDGYAELLALLHANCAQAGALRIDHAMSLARLYWIPPNADPRSGTYVTYPLEDLRGVVALASARAGCVVIGEDLGTVPAGFREAMAATGVLSYRILFFERRSDGSFARPEEYPPLALAASGTHDLPTIPAWLRGDDIGLRHRLALLETPPEAERAHRARERELLAEALIAHGDLAPGDAGDDTAIVIAANRYLADGPCAIVMAQLDDILGEREPVNVPGTSTEYPNWRRKLALDLDAIASDPRLARLCDTLAMIRPRPRNGQ